jgi:uncharacterized protein YerC
MRISASYGKEKIRMDQLNVLVKTLKEIKTEQDLKFFLETLISESEMVYIGQRLDIIRMLAKNFNYDHIKDEINVSSGTISHAQSCLDVGGDKFKKMVLTCKFKLDKKPIEPSRVVSISRGNGFINPKMPGAIR